MHFSITGDKHNYLVPSRGCISQHMKLAEFISKMPVSAPFPTSKVRESVAPIEDQAVVGFVILSLFLQDLESDSVCRQSILTTASSGFM